MFEGFELSMIDTGEAAYHSPEAFADYRRCWQNPQTIHAFCEDYRRLTS